MSKIKPIEKNDYVIVKTQADVDVKPTVVLLKVRSAENTLTGRIEKDPHLKPDIVSFEQKDVIANLGPNPYPGNVFGHNTRALYKGSIVDESVGKVFMFCEPPVAAVEALLSSFPKVKKRLKHHGLDFLINPDLCTTEILAEGAAGKFSGLYCQSSDEEKSPSRIRLTCGDQVKENISIPTWEYVLIHELGHRAHLRYLVKSSKADAAWISLYAETRKLSDIPASFLKSSLKSFLSTPQTLKDLAGSLPEEDVPKLRAISKWINEKRGVSPRELALLSMSGDSDTIKDLWPTVDLFDRKAEPLVTKYALKNYRELFAEAFAFYLLEKKLPESVSSLMERSIAYVVKQK